MLDILLKGGMIFDGTGAAARRGDVGILDGRVAGIGEIADTSARETVVCTGSVVCPGFIDIHTHYDAQILWDNQLTPSSWLGVTTVLMGNCGFSIAPTRPAGRSMWIETMENVEAMSRPALEAGITWEFESFSEYLDLCADRKPALNVAALVGHTALRMFVMGADAYERPSNDHELSVMRHELVRSLEAGGRGFATSRSPAHVGPGGPSRSESNCGAVRSIRIGRCPFGLARPDAADGRWSRLRYGAIQGTRWRRTGQPVTWCSLHQGVEGGRHFELSDATTEARKNGADLWAQMSCLPVITQFALSRPYVLESVPAFGELSLVDADERYRRYGDPAWRRRAKEEVQANREGRTFEIDMDRLRISELPAGADESILGKSVGEIARESGEDAFDAFIEIGLSTELKANFDLVLFNADEDEVAELLSRPSTLLGLSDAGAHTSQLCDASFGPHLLGRFVRERKDFDLAYGIWRLTGHPASVLGLSDRGVLKTGSAADICVFDPVTISEGVRTRVADQPAGAERVIKTPTGVQHVLVNGTFIRRDGCPLDGTGAGHILR